MNRLWQCWYAHIQATNGGWHPTTGEPFLWIWWDGVAL